MARRPATPRSPQTVRQAPDLRLLCCGIISVLRGCEAQRAGLGGQACADVLFPVHTIKCKSKGEVVFDVLPEQSAVRRERQGPPLTVLGKMAGVELSGKHHGPR